MKNKRRSSSIKTYAAVAAVVVLLLVGAGISAMANFTESSWSNCTVTDKDMRVRTSEEAYAPRAYTSCGTFEIRDVPPFFFGAGDIYGQLEVGETYSLTTRGWRVPFLSMFPAITGVK